MLAITLPSISVIPDLPEGCDSKVTVVLSRGQNKDMQCGRATRSEVNYQ